jgi:YVTN family beta-propeller protein
VGHLDNSGNILARIVIGNAPGSQSDPRNKRGPRGLALNASTQRLYVLNRISNTITIIDTSNDTVLKEIPVGSFDPTPTVIRNGRGFLYDAKLSGNGNASCATCHIDGDNDLIAWDLGDPGGNMKTVTLTRTNGTTLIGQEHPMKGPMMTQTLRGLANNEPFHWRGDKTNFIDFNATFNTLFGGATMNDPDMTAFRDFINTIIFAPNPNQNLDRTYPTNFPGGGNAQQGLAAFSTQSTGIGPCTFCHIPPPGTGSANVIRPASADFIFQNVKQPHFRNLYQKIGFNRGTNVDSPVGFGFMHDGEEASIVTFLSRTLFGSIPANVKTNLSAFLLSWDNGTAPAVGYSRTVVATNVTSISLSNDWSLLEGQAFLTNVDLVVKGTLDGVPHGMLYQPSSPSSGIYKLDSTNMPPLTRAQLMLKVQAGDTLTLLGAPPGSGNRIGLDRNANGVLDADEPAPKLQIVSSGTSTLISWPFIGGYALETTANLSTASWSPVAGPVEIVNGQNTMSVSLTPEARFYRLRGL